MARPLIILATDLGVTSQGAFHHALKIALAQEARLHIVRIHERSDPEPSSIEAFPHVREALVRWGALESGAPASAIAERLGLQVRKAEVVARRPETGLEQIVAKEAPDLIVMGTRGLDGLDALLHGSFSETLARHAHTPALFVPAHIRGFVAEADGAVTLESVLVPVANAPDASPALAAAARMLSDLAVQAPINALHVGHGGSAPQLRLPNDRACSLLARKGPVVDTIVAVAAETAAGLIVMATNGHDSLLDSIRGSTTEQVLRRAHRPLLAVPVA